MTDRRYEQRAHEINGHIETLRSSYPDLWVKITSDWKSSTTDAAWLTYSANYLLSTAGVKWALDPFSPFTRLGEVPPHNFVSDLSSLQVIVLSHAHADHLDMNIISALVGMPITWIIPEFVREKIDTFVKLPEYLVISPEVGVPITLGNLILTPFEARHFHGQHGVPEMGYLAEFSGKRWLFPGDTRDYSMAGLPPFSGVDGVFAHLWLGRACALGTPPPLLDSFCQYFLSMRPKRMVVTHLQEIGRGPLDYWTINEYNLVYANILKNSANTVIDYSMTGHKVDLTKADLTGANLNNEIRD